MESIKSLAKSMLEDVTLGHIVQQFKPINGDGEDSPLTNGEDNLDEEEFGQQDAKSRLIQTLSGRFSEVAEDDAMAMAQQGGDPAMQGAEAGAQAQTGGTLGAAGGNMGGGGGYAPGTAPTMPESIDNKGTPTMEKVDKDVAAMLNSLKKYDKLTEGVLGMATVGMANAKIVEDDNDKDDAEIDADKNDIEADELDESGPAKKDVPAFLRKEKGGDWKTSKDDLDKEDEGKASSKAGLDKKKEEKGINEGADTDVLEWMSRFSKLGNMKGYGR